MSDEDFYSLYKILDLKPGKESFTSFAFLKYIANHSPKQTSNEITDPSHTARFRQIHIPKTEEPDKIYFIGWNNHRKDNRKARNFAKTQLLLGEAIANYCQENNISSMWSANPKDKKKVIHPKDIHQ